MCFYYSCDICVDVKCVKDNGGYSLGELVKRTFQVILEMKSFGNARLIYIVDKLAELEQSMALGGNESLYLSSFVSLFQLARYIP